MAVMIGAVAYGGHAYAADQTTATTLHGQRASSLSYRRPPPPPTSDATLALASASATGKAARGSVCGTSADGSKVLFSSDANNLISGDKRFTQDLFLKDLNDNGITRVVAGTPFCLALTPDANTVVYTVEAPSIFPHIRVKNLTTGLETVVTPPLGTYPNVTGYQFAGVSDDGLRVAFIAQPTRSCRLYDCTALGPARMLLRDLATGQLINLEGQVRLTTTQGRAAGNARLSPDGRTLAFSTYAPYPEVRDNNNMSDVFALDLASGALQLVNADGDGSQVSFRGFSLSGPAFGVQDFLCDNSKIAFFASAAIDIGAAGIYVKDLASGALTRIFGKQINVDGYRAQVSFSDDGRRAAYVISTGNTATGKRVPAVLDVASDTVMNPATLSDGTVGNGNTTVSALMSRDGQVAVFDNNSTNLLGGQSTLGGAELRAYRKLLP